MTQFAHGTKTPYTCGAMDAYYRWRVATLPHKYVKNERIEDLTPEEVKEYFKGYEEQDERKYYGDD
jgi:hypothetical protein